MTGMGLLGTTTAIAITTPLTTNRNSADSRTASITIAPALPRADPSFTTNGSFLAPTSFRTRALRHPARKLSCRPPLVYRRCSLPCGVGAARRSEEHTSELQSHLNLLCRLLLG